MVENTESSADGDILRPDASLLRILICPVSKGPLQYNEATQELISEQARLAYPIRKGIPIMLESEARLLD